MDCHVLPVTLRSRIRTHDLSQMLLSEMSKRSDAADGTSSFKGWPLDAFSAGHQHAVNNQKYLIKLLNCLIPEQAS